MPWSELDLYREPATGVCKNCLVEIYIIYAFLPDNIRMYKSRKIRETGRVAHILSENLKGRDHLQDLIVDARMTLKSI